MPRLLGAFAAALLALAVLAHAALRLTLRPSTERDWSPDSAVPARAEFTGDSVTIRDIRDFRYRTGEDYDVRYYDKAFDLRELESMWFAVVPFTGYPAGAAHTLVSFGFSGGGYVAISVEARKEKGESYSVLRGLLRQYELFYVVADERDVIALRTNHRKDDVFLYPVTADRENMRRMFVSMLHRANALAETPEFYNTLTNTCTTNLVDHANEISPRRIPRSHKILMPAFSDELARDIGLIDSDLPIGELRARHRVNERALAHADDPHFSQRIREFGPD